MEVRGPNTARTLHFGGHKCHALIWFEPANETQVEGGSQAGPMGHLSELGFSSASFGNHLTKPTAGTETEHRAAFV